MGSVSVVAQSLEAVEGPAAAVADAPQSPQPPAAPILSASFAGKRLHLAWNDASGARYYRILQHPAGASRFALLVEDITTTSHVRDVGAHRPNWFATRYVLEACNAVGCTTSNQVSTLDAVLRAIGLYETTGNTGNEGSTVALALSGDGNTLAAGRPGESGAATGVDGDHAAGPGTPSSGAVHVFARRGRIWLQQAHLKASNASAGDAFGSSISVSHDGDTLAVGAYLEDSLGAGVDGDPGGVADNNSNAGAVYVFGRSKDRWSQQAYVKASNPRANAYFGHAVALAADARTLAVGAIGENAGGLNAGAVYVFARSASVWSQQAYVKASKVKTNAYFGSSVALSTDGSSLVIETRGDSGIPGVDESAYVFTRDADVWSQQPHQPGADIAKGDALRRSLDLTLEERR